MAFYDQNVNSFHRPLNWARWKTRGRGPGVRGPGVWKTRGLRAKRRLR